MVVSCSPLSAVASSSKVSSSIIRSETSKVPPLVSVGHEVQFTVIFFVQSTGDRCLSQLIDEPQHIHTIDAVSILDCVALQRTPIDTLASADAESRETLLVDSRFYGDRTRPPRKVNRSLYPCKKQARRTTSPVVPFLVSNLSSSSSGIPPSSKRRRRVAVLLPLSTCPQMTLDKCSFTDLAGVQPNCTARFRSRANHQPKYIDHSQFPIQE